jgi:hypothetical protein
MNPVLMFLHGMGETDPNWLDSYSKLLKKRVACQCLSLFYGQVVLDTPLTVLAQEKRERSEEDLQEDRLLAFVDGFIVAELRIRVDESTLMPSGRYADRATKVAFDTYSYAVRYLLRRSQSSAVLDAVTRQVKEHIVTNQIAPNSITLVAHSLGTVVALDLIANEELRRYVRKYVSLGSPLGFIARIPGVNGRILPLANRKMRIPWIDFSTRGDIVSRVRVSKTSGFAGNPLRTGSINGKYKRPHSAYFFEDAAVRQWSMALR